VVNDHRWKIKGSYVGKEAFNSYFGYPSSMPPMYSKARGNRKWRGTARAAKKGEPAVKAKTKYGGKATGVQKRRAPGKTVRKKSSGKPLAVTAPSARAGG
jgi:hypothetical protein